MLDKHLTNIIESTKDTNIKSYARECSNKLKDIMEEPSATNIQKIEQFNTYIFKTWDTRPQLMLLPVVIPTTKQLFVLDPSRVNEIKSIELPISKSLDPSPVLKALIAISKTWSSNTQSNAFIKTNGVLGTKMNKEEVD